MERMRVRLSRRAAMILSSGVAAFFATGSRTFASPSNIVSKETALVPAAYVSSLKLELFKTAGIEAVAMWERLKVEDRGWPIIVGDDRQLSKLVKSIDDFGGSQSAEQILKAADALHFPEELRIADEAFRMEIVEDIRRDLALPDKDLPKEYNINEDGDLIELSPEMARKKMQAEVDSKLELPVGQWPTTSVPEKIPLPIYDSNWQLRESVNILRVPVSTSAEVFAHLCWAGFNMCPPSEVHVAALRKWHELYGAELVALTDDSITLRVSRRPQSKEAALDLAREQILYNRGEALTLAPVAYSLMTSDWWFFWWD